MSSTAVERLAWEISASQPGPAFFGAHVRPDDDVRTLMQPAMTSRFRSSDMAFLNVESSLDYLQAIFEGQALPAGAGVVFLEDALARSSGQGRERLNRGRELLRRQNKTLVFVESRAGSPEMFDDLRDLLATFRSVVDLRPSVIEEDHLWDTAGAFCLERVAASLPEVVVRGSLLIKGGVVHRKAAKSYRCPTCGEALTRTTTTLSFKHAAPEKSVQSVAGFVCECGETWPDPEAVTAAHRAAFGR